MRFILVIFISCLYLSVHAQNKSYSGVILDSETNEPLEFASISIIGKQMGTISNSEGHFILGMENIAPTDTILVSYIGYESFKIITPNLQEEATIKLKPSILEIQEVRILTTKLTAEDIIKLVIDNYEKNHPAPTNKQRIFYHKYSKTPVPPENKLTLKKSDFVGLDKSTFDALLSKLPDEFLEYQDAIIELYSSNNNHKLIPIEGISLEENSQQEFMSEAENKLGKFFEDIDKTVADKDTYYKFRTGIIGFKFGNKSNDNILIKENKNDPKNYSVYTEYIKNAIVSLFQDYTSLKSNNLEFFSNRNDYSYSLNNVSTINNESVYEISFSPKKHGLFEGTMYISTSTYAILQLDFAFAKGKTSEKIQIFGLGHLMNFKKGRVIYEKGKSGYFVKYIYAQQQESGSVERDFVIMKKRKRFLIDKELNELKIEADLTFNTDSYEELLVLDRDETTAFQIDQIKQPSIMKFKKERSYTSEMWGHQTVIAPTTQLKKYERK